MCWRNDYFAALQDRDEQEKPCREFFHDYTTLADRVARLENSNISRDIVESMDTQAIATGYSPPRNEVKLSFSDITKDLLEAQQARTWLEARLKNTGDELRRFRISSKVEGKRTADLVSERSNLITKMRDRDEELKEKSKLLENVHDETVALTLQLNIAEDQNMKLKRENQDLVDRWMSRVAQEAEALNSVSKFS